MSAPRELTTCVSVDMYIVSRGCPASPSSRTFHPARWSRAVFSPTKFAMAPPERTRPPEPSRQPEQLGREPPHQMELDLGRGRRELPPADVGIQAGGEQIGDRAGHGARAGDVGHEPRVSRELGAFEDHVVQVREERVVGHRLVRHVERDGVVDLLRRPPCARPADRASAQELLPRGRRRDPRTPVRAAGSQSRSSHRRRSFDAHRSFTAAQPEPLRLHRATEDVLAERLDHAPDLTLVFLDRPELQLQEIRRQLEVDRELVAGRDREACPAGTRRTGCRSARTRRPTPACSWRSAPSRPARPTSSRALVAQSLTDMCATCPVIPSGPNVSTVSGRTSAMMSTTFA